MGRKNLLKDLLETKSADPKPEGPAQDPASARPRKGAIGAVSKSIADLKSRSVAELDPKLISAGGLKDRLEINLADHEALMDSIRDYGQQVPVLVRPHPDPDKPEHYQIVYGRRRLAALSELGMPVKALIRDLDDHALILAQGQENAARRDLTFIEKVNFARQMREAGYDRKTLCAALHIDKTVISRMLMVADCVPIELIEMIGPAPSVGRDRWLALANGLEADMLSLDELCAIAELAGEKGSDASFEAVLAALTPSGAAQRRPATLPKPVQLPPAGATAPLKGAGGKTIGTYRQSPESVSLTLSADRDAAFGLWLLSQLEDLHSQWQADQEKS